MKNIISFLISFLFLESQFLYAADLPSGENVVAGNISISSSDNAMTITQSSQQSIIEWNSFDIGMENNVTFNQPSINASALNRVISGNPTTLAGSLNANGKVFVVNENGVYFTPTSTISAHSFGASTLALSNDDFLNNKFLFKADDKDNIFSSIIHKGSITTLDGGFTALLGGAINNEGTINANLGKIGIGAGKEITLDLSGDKFLQVSVPFNEAITLLDQNAEELNTIINHEGTSTANRIDIDVGAAKNVIQRAVNIPGNLVATTASQKNGVITLGSGSDIVVAGNLTAKEGGNIKVTGGFLSFGGDVDVSGTVAGKIDFDGTGEISLGGNLNASSGVNTGGNINVQSDYKIVQTYGSTINTSGHTSGGDVFLSAPNIMSSGTISSKGNQQGGYIDIESEGYIRLLSSNINVAGNTQGGLVRIGGEFQGKNNLTRTPEQQEVFVDRWDARPSLKNAKTVLVSDGSSIDISSSNGKAGTAIIWSDHETTMIGNINARGTIGGAVEISSKDTLRHVGLSNVNISEGGHLLLDPKNITVGTGVTSQNWVYRGIIGEDYDPSSTNNYDETNATNSKHYYGSSVTLSDDATLLAVGATGDKGNAGNKSDAGVVYLYQFTDGDFSNAQLKGRIGKGYSGTGNIDVGNYVNKSDKFGRSVSFNSDGTRLVVGATGDGGNPNTLKDINGNKNTGAVYLFEFSDTSYGGGELVGRIGNGYTVGAAGSIDEKSIDLRTQGEGNKKGVLFRSDLFGSSVSLSGDGKVLAVGVKGDDGWNEETTDGRGSDYEKTNSGSVFIIGFDDGNFSNGEVKARIGHGYDNNTSSGGCYHNGKCATFTNDVSTKDIADIVADGNNDFFGTAVALNHEGSLLAVGNSQDDGLNANGQTKKNHSGSVRLFKFMNASSTDPVPATSGKATYVGSIGIGYDYLDTNGSSHDVSLTKKDYFGTSVAFDKDANRLAVGYWDNLNPGSEKLAGAVNLYKFSDNLTSPEYVSTIGNGHSGGENLSIDSSLETNDKFGEGVAFNETGTRLVASAMHDDGNNNVKESVGAVHLFKFDNADFENPELYSTMGKDYASGSGILYDLADQLDNDDEFGRSVSLDSDGNRMAVSASNDQGTDDDDGTTGAVYLFTFDNTNFSNPTLKGRIGTGYTGDYSLDLTQLEAGRKVWRVALDGDGDRLVLSQRNANRHGQVYTVKFANTDFETPEYVGTIGMDVSSSSGNLDITNLSDSGDDEFTAVDLTDDGSRLVIGSFKNGGKAGNQAQSGAVYLIKFDKTLNNTSTDFLNPQLVGTMGIGYNNTSTSKDFDMTTLLNSSDRFGTEVKLTKDGKILAVSAQQDDGSGVNDGTNAGAVYLFEFTNSDFEGITHAGTIGIGYSDPDKKADYDTTSISDWGTGQLAIDGDGNRLAIGDFAQDDIRIFGFQDTELNGPSLQFTLGLGQTGANSVDTSNHGVVDADTFPNSIALDDTGTLMAVGVTGDDGLNNDATDAGAVYLWSDSIMRGATSYTNFKSSNVVINKTELEEFLNNGVDVTLQANSDITIDSAITVTGAGSLNLHAGRDVNINSDINLAANLEIIASDTEVNGVDDSNRIDGIADIVASSASLTAENLNIQLLDGEGITEKEMGDINLSTVTATTGSLMSANFSVTGASAEDKTYDGTTTATINSGSITGLNLTGADLTISASGSFNNPDIGSAKDVPISYEISGFASDAISVEDSAGALVATPVANINAGNKFDPPGVPPDEEKEKIAVQEKINKDVFDDVSRIVSFISVDGASNAALIEKEFITSFPQVDALSIQRL